MKKIITLLSMVLFVSIVFAQNNSTTKVIPDGIKFSDGSIQTTASGSIWHIVEPSGTGDDYKVIQNAINAYSHVCLSPNKNYIIKDRLLISEDKTLKIPAGTILKYEASSASFAAIEMGNGATLVGEGYLNSSRFGYNNGTWDMVNAKAAIMITGWRVKIDFGNIRGFEYGIQLGGNFPIVSGFKQGS